MELNSLKRLTECLFFLGLHPQTGRLYEKTQIFAKLCHLSRKIHPKILETKPKYSEIEFKNVDVDSYTAAT